ncbi:FitA-like ribbon-helix-helix domain-containing protein [Nocardia sp. CA-128927]|uniref:FitA-like ribbon-helix-helix domain-containing protein n=1 Tax=Nocardia sp. CA-128927 TaxID=3239975 RepID=UPI003D979B26
MVTVQILDVPDEDVEVLRQCAAIAGLSLDAYLRQHFIELARRLTKAEAMARIREALERDPWPGADAGSTLEALREVRGE